MIHVRVLLVVPLVKKLVFFGMSQFNSRSFQAMAQEIAVDEVGDTRSKDHGLNHLEDDM